MGLDVPQESLARHSSMNIVIHLSISLLFFLSISCTHLPRTRSNVSKEPVVAKYIQIHDSLVKKCDILGSGRTSILIEHGRRYPKDEGLDLRCTLPAGTKVVLRRIDKIQGDGFVLFEARGKALPEGESKAIPFSYKWGHGGTAPQAPWEAPEMRLKKVLGIE